MVLFLFDIKQFDWLFPLSGQECFLLEQRSIKRSSVSRVVCVIPTQESLTYKPIHKFNIIYTITTTV